MRRYTPKKYYGWSENIAYLVGLFASDGCLSNDYRHLNMTSKDMDIMNATLEILCRHTPVKAKRSPSAALAYYVQFSDVALYTFLTDAGLTPNKSKTIGALNIPDNYFRDFLRGLFDGDGTVYGYKDTRWKSSFMFYIGFISASSTFLSWLRLRITDLAGASGGIIKQGIRVQTLSYAKKDSLKLFEYMYGHKPSYRLTRKFIKFRDFIKNDPHAIITPVVARVL